MDVRPAQLLADGTLAMRRRRLHYVGRAPARFVPLRSSSPDSVRILDDDRDTLIGTVEAASACRIVHPGAIYLHQGESWLVRDLDLEDNVARAVRFDCDYFTEPRTRSSLEVISEDEHVCLGDSGTTMGLGTVEVTSQVVGFRMRLHDARGHWPAPVADGEARPAAPAPRDQGVLVRGPAGLLRWRRRRRHPCARHCARMRAHRHRHPAALRDLRQVGSRWPLHACP